jgi:hypothetical protein
MQRAIENFNNIDFELRREDRDAIALLDNVSSFLNHHYPELVKSLSSVKMDV